MPRPPFATWQARHAKAALALAVDAPIRQDAAVLACATLSYDGVSPELNRALGGVAGTPAGRSKVRQVIAAFLADDHWQNGRGFPGFEEIAAGDSEVSRFAARAVRDAFLHRNLIGECASRHRDGVAGKPVRWGFASRLTEPGTGATDNAAVAANDRVQAASAEIAAPLTDWWNRERLDEKIAAVAHMLTWAERVAFRLYPTPDDAPDGPVSGSTPSATRTIRPRPVGSEPPLAAALRAFSVDVALPGRAAIYTDPRSEAPASIYEGAEYVPGSDDVPGTETRRALYEVAYVERNANGEPETVLMAIPEVGAGEIAPTVAPARLRIGGRLPLFVCERPALFGDDVAQMQRGYNLCLTALPRTVLTAGWLEEILVNARVPGRMESVDVGNGKIEKRFIPDAVVRGPTKRQYVEGLPQVGAQGEITYATPQVIHRPPVTPSPEAMEAIERTLLHRVKQAHVLATGTGEPSGEFLRQARAEALGELRTTGNTIAAAVVWILETALALAEAVMESPGKWTTIVRATAQCRLDVGPIPSAELAANAAEVAAGTLSLETHRTLAGDDDPAAEVGIIRADEPYRMDRMSKVLTMAGLAADAGIPVGEIAKPLDATPEETRMLKQASEIDPAAQDTPGQPGSAPAAGAASSNGASANATTNAGGGA